MNSYSEMQSCVRQMADVKMYKIRQQVQRHGSNLPGVLLSISLRETGNH